MRLNRRHVMHATHFVISLPTRSLPRPSLRRPLAVAALLLLLLLCVIPAHAQTMAPPFLRVNDATLAAAVIRGAEQSPTFRALLERLAMSDLIVYLQRGRLSGNTAAATQLIAASGGYRYLRVTIEIDPEADAGLALIGQIGRASCRERV